jgi:hypothetical protein
MRPFTKYFSAVVIAALTIPLVSVKANPLVSAKSSNSTSGGVLVGPLGSPTAVGPTGRDDDFTNLSIDGGIAASSDGVTMSPAVKIFKNTVENVGPTDDAFIITTPSIPANFRVEISTDFGDHYTSTDSTNYSITVPVSYRASNTFFVRVTAPAGLKILTSYDTVIRATSTIDPAVTNATIDRLYAGFIRVEATTKFVGSTQPVEVAAAAQGSEIEFTITFTNISSADGSGNSLLTAYDLVISENGNAAPNNWGATTDHIVGASDNHGGRIIGDREGSTWLTDIVTSLDAGRSGVFKFKRRIK